MTREELIEDLSKLVDKAHRAGWEDGYNQGLGDKNRPCGCPGALEMQRLKTMPGRWIPS